MSASSSSLTAAWSSAASGCGVGGRCAGRAPRRDRRLWHAAVVVLRVVQCARIGERLAGRRQRLHLECDRFSSPRSARSSLRSRRPAWRWDRASDPSPFGRPTWLVAHRHAKVGRRSGRGFLFDASPERGRELGVRRAPGIQPLGSTGDSMAHRGRWSSVRGRCRDTAQAHTVRTSREPNPRRPYSGGTSRPRGRGCRRGPRSANPTGPWACERTTQSRPAGRTDRFRASVRDRDAVPATPRRSAHVSDPGRPDDPNHSRAEHRSSTSPTPTPRWPRTASGRCGRSPPRGRGCASRS